MKDKILEKVTDFASALGDNLYLRSLRDAFILAIPFLVLGGFAIIFNSVIFVENGFMTNVMSNDTIVVLREFGTRMVNGSMNLFSLFIVLIFSYNIAVNKKYKDPFMVALVSMAALFIVQPLNISLSDLAGNDVTVSGAVAYTYFSATGLFVAMLTAASVSTLYMFIDNKGLFNVEFEGNIPPSVPKAFNAMSSVVVALSIFGAVVFLITILTNMELYDLIIKIIQAPLVNITTSLPGFLFLTFLTNLLFSFGIHPGGIIDPILEPSLYVALQQNADAYAAGVANADIPNIIVYPFKYVYGHIGGTGATFSLLIAIKMVSHHKEHKTLAKVAIPTTIFNINEPITFGFPVVFNPIIMIPFIFLPQVNYIIAYIVTSLDLAGKLVVYVPWSMPPFINAFVASGGDIRNVFLQLGLILIDLFVWIIFLKTYERMLDKELD